MPNWHRPRRQAFTAMKGRWALAFLSIGLAVLCPVSAPGQDGGAAQEYNAEGVRLYTNGEWEEAIGAFELAYGLAPNTETIQRNLCNAYMAHARVLADAKDFQSATEELELAIDVAPTNPRPLVQLGAYYLRRNLVPDAIFRLEEAIELASEDIDAHDLLGDAYYRDNDLKAALEHWEWVRGQDARRKGLSEKIEKAFRENAVEENFRKSTSLHFDVKYGRGTEGYKVRNLLGVLERAYRQIGQDLGNAFPPTPVQVNVYSAEEFSDATLMSRHVGALYDGKIRVPVTTAAGYELDESELKRRLFHEYVHVVIRHLLDDNTPWWVNEGLAETLSGELSDAYVSFLSKANEEGLLFDLGELEGDQLTRLDPESLNLAYRQAHYTVHYLRSRFGRRTMKQFLASLADGLDAESALRKHYYRNYMTLQREIEHDLR